MVTRYRVTAGTLIIDLGDRRPVLSSAPRGGGLSRARYILNHHVAANPRLASGTKSRDDWGDPSRDLGKVAGRLGVEPRCVGLMTAVPMKHLVVVREEKARLWVEGFVTVGVSNAVRAGEPPPPGDSGRAGNSAGTINVVLVTNARLAVSALVGLVQVATEAKTAALWARSVPSRTGRGSATGTGTDAVAVASGSGPRVRYSGTHTELGAMVGRLVFQGVTRGLQRWARWSAGSAAAARTTRPGGDAGRERKRL